MSRKAIPVVMGVPPSQAERMERLAKYCNDLDGTEVRLIPVSDEGFVAKYPKNPHGCRQAHALHTVAEQIDGPFIWIEADSIPLKPYWARDLRDEYRRGGKEFLLSSDQNPPHDMVGGIGIYGPHTRWLLPKHFPLGGWDGWMYEHVRPLIHFTPLIQHSYGIYPSNVLGVHCTPHRFPRDQKIIRPETVIFHRDRYQDLLGPNETPVEEVPKPVVIHDDKTVFRHSGDIGDVIAALPILRAKGGGKIILFHDESAPKGMSARESLKGARFDAIKPLLEMQPYVHGVEWSDNIKISEGGDFRKVLRPQNESLTERQARHVGAWPVSLAPWIFAPNVVPHKRIVCARSPRYHNDEFPWTDVAETYGDRLLFVGLDSEHADFERVVGRQVEKANTPDLLEVARIIAGAPQFIGNQSAPLWIAMGLGVKVICEGYPAVPNSVIMRLGSFFAFTTRDMETLRNAFAKVRS